MSNWLLLTLFLLATVGCCRTDLSTCTRTTQPVFDPIEHPLPRCGEETRYWIDPAFSPLRKSQIRDAAQAWETGSGNRVCFQETQAVEESSLRIVRVGHRADLRELTPIFWPSAIGLYTATLRSIWIVEPDAALVFVAVVEHEVGHYLGLKHDDHDQETVMRSYIDEVPESLKVMPGIPLMDRLSFCEVRGCSATK